MATRTIANGGGNWSATGTWVEAAVPTSADDVVATATSGSVTIDTAATCKTLDLTGYVATLTHNSAVTLTVAGNVFKLVAGMTYTKSGSSSSSALAFTSTSGTCLITFAAKTHGNLTFDGIGGTFQLQDASTALSTTTTTVTLTNGTLDTNGKACSWGLFASSNANIRTLTLGASVVTIGGTGTSWNVTTATSMTLSAGTSAITFNGNASTTFAGGGLTYYDVTFTTTGGVTVVISGANSFHNFAYTPGSTSTNTVLQFSADQTASSALTLTAPTNKRTQVTSNTTGTARTITAAVVALTAVDFQDTTGAGAAASFTGTNLGDGGGNSGITFPASATFYWVGGTGSWTDNTNHWSTTTNGAPGARVPSAHDNVVFDASSFTAASQTVTMDFNRIGRMDASAATNGPTFDINLSSRSFLATGTFALPTSCTITTTAASGFLFRGAGSYTITLAGHAFWSLSTTFDMTGTYTLADNFSNGGSAITINRGTFVAASRTLTIGSLASSNSTTRTIDLTGATVNLSSSGTVWNIGTVTGLTATGWTSSTINVTNTAAATKTITQGTSGTTYKFGTVAIAADAAPGNSVGTVTFSGACPAVAVSITGPKYVLLSTTAKTWDTLTLGGSSSNQIDLRSSTPGTRVAVQVSTQTVATYTTFTDVEARGPSMIASTGCLQGGNSWGLKFNPNASGQGTTDLAAVF